MSLPENTNMPIPEPSDIWNLSSKLNELLAEISLDEEKALSSVYKHILFVDELVSNICSVNLHESKNYWQDVYTIVASIIRTMRSQKNPSSDRKIGANSLAQEISCVCDRIINNLTYFFDSGEDGESAKTAKDFESKDLHEKLDFLNREAIPAFQVACVMFFRGAITSIESQKVKHEDALQKWEEIEFLRRELENLLSKKNQE